MLSWLSGGSKPEQQDDFADMTFQEQPDTPAHVFAARAIKYRLWGTPKPPDTTAKPRDRPTSCYGSTSAQQCDPSASPSKPNGILMTPGTANVRRSKTVSFDAQRNERVQRPQTASRNKSAPVVPGKFPTPSRIDMTAMEEPAALPQSQSKLTEKLRNARTTNNSNEVRVEIKRKSVTDQEKVGENLSNPLIDWKERYEQYSARTEREMKRLIAKQQAAKHYAREKDTAASELAEHLRTERKRISLLESQISNLNSEVSRMHKDLQLATSRAAANPSKSINDYNDAPAKPSPLKSASLAAPAIPDRSPSRRPPPLTTDNDIWASSFLATSPSANRKPNFSDDFISSTLRRTRLPPKTSNPNLNPDTNPLRPRDVNLESTTPQQTPPSSRKRTPVLSPSSSRNRRSAHHTPVRLSARRSRAALNAEREVKVHEQRHADVDDSLNLPLPSPEAGFAPVQSVRPVKAVAGVESSPFVATPRGEERMGGVGELETGKKACGEGRGKENRSPIVQGWKEVVGVKETPRKSLDAERRAKAAARIAARRREREMKGSVM
ncbi:hypothetical protein B9Z65_6265 [Elsinoe australis]|uniref:Spindle pole body-associated protein cut12 domain-containing protein n=1 Tax=Elsinoe australis TaxID=40998 RepID=A0A2P8A850_9PEZI|nr:hypothetical protein B9Z65_6265 [Elsinoe australis]